MTPLEIILSLTVWTVVGALYYVVAMLGSWGRTKRDFNVFEQALIAPAYIIARIIKR